MWSEVRLSSLQALLGNWADDSEVDQSPEYGWTPGLDLWHSIFCFKVARAVSERPKGENLPEWACSLTSLISSPVV